MPLLHLYINIVFDLSEIWKFIKLNEIKVS